MNAEHTAAGPGRTPQASAVADAAMRNSGFLQIQHMGMEQRTRPGASHDTDHEQGEPPPKKIRYTLGSAQTRSCACMRELCPV